MNSQHLTIRKFNLKDYRNIMNLWDRVDIPSRPKGRDRYENIKSQVECRSSIILVAELNTQIVGAVLGSHDGRKGWINRLAVENEYRRRGIARRLVSELESEFNKIGIEVIACLIEGNNNVSTEFFRKLGYSDWDIKYLSKRRSVES